MSVPIPSPSGAGGCVSALTPKAAKKFFEFFLKGTRRDAVVLGDPVEVQGHFVRGLNYKVMCSASTGECNLCQQAATSADIAIATPDYMAPGAIALKGWFVQRVLVFTAAMEEKARELIEDAIRRGHRLNVNRESAQKFALKVASRVPAAMSHEVPPGFDVLPFLRARYGLAQDPANPPVFFRPFPVSLLKATAPGTRPKPVALGASDRHTADEHQKLLAKIEESREQRKKWDEDGRDGSGGAPVPAAPKPPADPTTSAAEPEDVPEAEPIDDADDIAPTATVPADPIEDLAADVKPTAKPTGPRTAGPRINPPAKKDAGPTVFGDILGRVGKKGGNAA
jgi:hypothetical protein